MADPAALDPVRTAVWVARAFHEEYEQLAPLYGWATQEASRVDWDDVPENQRLLMVHTVGNLLAMGLIAAGERRG